MPIFYHKNNETGVDKDSPFYYLFYEITNNFEEMVIKTSKTTSFLQNSYLNRFKKFAFQNFSDELFIDTYYMPNLSLLNLLRGGLIPVVSNFFEKIRFLWVQCYFDQPNTINDLKWCDISYLILYIVRPWFNKMIEILNDEVNKFLDDARIIQISLFIVVIIILILSYFILWKSYEESLSVSLDRSFDLIKLIPEEIKLIIVSKLNE